MSNLVMRTERYHTLHLSENIRPGICGPVDLLSPCHKSQARDCRTHQTNEGCEKLPHLKPVRSWTPDSTVAPLTCHLTQCICQGTENALLSLGLPLSMFPIAQHSPLEFPYIHLPIHPVCLSIHLYLVLCLASMVHLPDWVLCLGSVFPVACQLGSLLTHLTTRFSFPTYQLCL